MTNVIVENICHKNVLRTSWQVANREAVLNAVAGLSVTPTLQAGVFLLRRIQHVVTAQTLRKEQSREIFNNDVAVQRYGGQYFSQTHVSGGLLLSQVPLSADIQIFRNSLQIPQPFWIVVSPSFPVMANRLFRQFSHSENTG